MHCVLDEHMRHMSSWAIDVHGEHAMLVLQGITVIIQVEAITFKQLCQSLCMHTLTTKLEKVFIVADVSEH